jgi:hypothetical protein|tara:strand:- start:359 stop:742 length:384 start_codon:yes stop_codon:yes gene_type:complete
MTDVAAALIALNIKGFSIRGEPTNEAEFNAAFERETGLDENGVSIMSSDVNDFGVTWSQVLAKLTELQNAEPMRLLREERDRKIAETDWWASSDLTMTDAQKKYRQDLRDITKSATSLDDVTWPEKP